MMHQSNVYVLGLRPALLTDHKAVNDMQDMCL